MSLYRNYSYLLVNVSIRDSISSDTVSNEATYYEYILAKTFLIQEGQ